MNAGIIFRTRTVIVLIGAVMAPSALLSAPGDEFWDDRFDVLGIDGAVSAIAVMGKDVFVGGQFSRAGSTAATNIARWDGTNWWALGAGVDGLGVVTLAVSGTNLYAGGYFNRAGDIEVNRIAQWDGLKWSALGGGVDGRVFSLATAGTNLFAGGRFSSAGGIIASNIARWDGSGWAAVGDGVSYVITGSAGIPRDRGYVNALAADGSRIYVGGFFDNAGGLRTRGVASWDGTAWQALGQGLNSDAWALTAVRSTLYVGGTFTSASGVAANRIARWDGQSWSSVGDGLGSTNYPTSVGVLLAREDRLFVAGRFEKAGSTNFVQWTGIGWQGFGSGISPWGGVGALATSGNQIFVGGLFEVAGGKPARNFSIWHIPEKLRIRRSQSSVEVSWPSSLSNFVLEAGMQLPGTNWTEVGKLPTLQNERFSITDEATAPQQFYRLRKKE